MPSQRPDWVTYFLGIAEAVSKRGDCTRRQVGAVLVRPDNTISSVGYNGTAAGVRGCLAGACPRGQLSYEELPAGVGYDTSSCIALHAEMNCLAFTREATDGYSMYVTDKPCYMCKSVIRAHRVKEVWYKSDIPPWAYLHWESA